MVGQEEPASKCYGRRDVDRGGRGSFAVSDNHGYTTSTTIAATFYQNCLLLPIPTDTACACARPHLLPLMGDVLNTGVWHHHIAPI